MATTESTPYTFACGTGNKRAERTVLTPDGGSMLCRDGPTAQRVCDELNFLVWCVFSVSGTIPTAGYLAELRDFYDGADRHECDFDPAPEQYLAYPF